VTSADIVVRTGVGLHARPAAALVAAAREFSCTLTVTYNGKVADAKSIIQILALGVEDDARVTLRADGDGEGAAIQAMVRLAQQGFRPDPTGGTE